MPTVSFTKMHGLGNDFVVIDGIKQTLPVLPITQIANRYTGIGCDQVLVIESTTHADFFCRIYNADGSEAEQCGNGLRCVARFIVENGLSKEKEFTIATLAGIFPVAVPDYEQVKVTLGLPIIQHQLQKIKLDGKELAATILSLGNPHAVIQLPSIQHIALQPLADEINKSFPNGINVGFMQILNRHHVLLRTVERGSGETWACGSNACATMAAGVMNGWLDRSVDIEFRLGKVRVEWERDDAPMKLIGPAAKVFEGSWD